MDARWQGSGFRREPQLVCDFKTPDLVSFGEHDFRVPLNNGLDYWTALQRQKVESKLIIFPDENDWILSGENSRFYFDQVREWLKHYLGSSAPKSDRAIPDSVKSK